MPDLAATVILWLRRRSWSDGKMICDPTLWKFIISPEIEERIVMKLMTRDLMEVEAKWSCTACSRIEKRRAVLRHHVSEVQGMEQNPAYIRIAVTGKGTAPSLHRINILKPAREPEILNRLHHEPMLSYKRSESSSRQMILAPYWWN